MLQYLRTIRMLQRHWGLPAALSILACCATARSKTEARALKLPGVEGEVSIRPRSTDWDVLVQIFLTQEYAIQSRSHAEALTRYYNAVLDAGETPVIIDCGANVGLAALWFSTIFPRAMIIAVEPEENNYLLLSHNAESRPNIRPVQAGIADRHTRIALLDPGLGSWGWQTIERAQGELETVTVADLVALAPRGRLLIVKIDIEGSEVELFRSNTAWVDETPLVVFESHDFLSSWRGTAHAILSTLTRETRDYFQRGENTFAFSHAILGPTAPTQPRRVKRPRARRLASIH